MSEKDIKEFDEKLLKEIEEAAERGSRKGGRKGQLILGILTVCVIIAVFFSIRSSIKESFNEFKSQLSFDSGAEEHDLAIDDRGLRGYTVADFADAVLGNSQQLNKLEVFKQEISDMTTLTNTGLFNIKIFTKVQYITYHGTAVYTVDLSKLADTDITLDEKNKIVTITIPKPEQEEINIPENQIEFGDVTKGVLAFGEMKMTVEDSAKLQAEVRAKMEEELVECNAQEQAERFAILSVWEMYNPVIKSIAPSYSLEIKY